jgi:glycosyltransferase involved in cell wall biosynthesis
MNIVIDLRPLIGDKLSGVEIFTRSLVKNLTDIDRENTYILWINAFSDQSKILSGFNGDNIIKIHTRIPNKILNAFLLFFKRPLLDRLISKKIGRDIDIFLLPDLRPLALRKGTKKVCVVHDLSFERYPQFFTRKTRLWHRLLNAKINLATFDAIIAVSEFTKKSLTDTYRIPSEKIKVIYEGPPAESESIPDEEKIPAVKRKYSLPPKYFFFLSTIEPRKNIQRLINAFVKFKKTAGADMKLVIGGAVHPSIFAKQKIIIHKDVMFTGFVPEEEKPYLFLLAEAFVYPSLYEGFGLPLLEAMRQLTPIMASDTSSIPEICGDAAIFFNPLNTDEMASVMHKILEPETQKILKLRMSERIKYFSWHKCATRTMHLLKSL